MRTVTNLLLCGFVVVATQAEVTLEPDMPFLWVQNKQTAVLKCCFNNNKGKIINFSWVRRHHRGNATEGPLNVTITDLVIKGYEPPCGNLSFISAQPSDSGLYQCLLDNKIFTHGTYLHVYIPLEKTIDLSESTKNKILTAEGVLLVLSVILPAATVLFQSKKLTELEKKKMKREEENIYQGLNLDDCCTTYDQIERSQAQGQYEDVCNFAEREEGIQLEKP
ncbi:B-cell antigen receptor complex-associated protein alpha chain [Cheilinus undulatus]|uniref:B-cell antigen receptor complex-associated protein alpha chain n=1 Tax=Cheilinus undulatus TaxID=241271 RepID=UPI001BD5A5C6|nr:B-cell antigen receptor complex-associated protein alpha chain [Cheilinus undulatus]